jgi:hypothetical protein
MENNLFNCTIEYMNHYLINGIYTQQFIDDFEKIKHQSIMDEISNLEHNKRSTNFKKYKKFKKLPLRGLYKIHFSNGSLINMKYNLQNHWDFQSNKFEQMALEVRKQVGDYEYEKFSQLLAQKFIDGYYARRKNSKLTGEWIVFMKHNQKNYYLTLAEHDESDEKIFNRIMTSCFVEFPELYERYKKLNKIT